jgi:hypothetical protein
MGMIRKATPKKIVVNQLTVVPHPHNALERLKKEVDAEE